VGNVECSMCINIIESVDHLLLKCPFAVKVWNYINGWCGWSDFVGESIRGRIDQANNIDGPEKIKDTASLIVMATVWYVWLARNYLIFNSLPLSVDGVVDKIKVNTFLWLKYRANMLDVMWHKWYNSPW